MVTSRTKCLSDTKRRAGAKESVPRDGIGFHGGVGFGGFFVGLGGVPHAEIDVGNFAGSLGRVHVRRIREHGHGSAELSHTCVCFMPSGRKRFASVTLTTFGCPTQSALHNREHFIFIGPSPLLDSVSG